MTVSSKLKDKVLQVGIEQRGIWGGHDGTLFEHFPEIKRDQCSFRSCCFMGRP
jgi:hypothetical protein